MSSRKISGKMGFEERVKRRNAFDASLVYGTRQFNLMTSRVEHINYRQENDNHWKDPQTGIIADCYAEPRKCPLCASVRSEMIFVKSGFPHVKCQTCELVYVTPVLNKAEYTKLWSAEDSWEKVLESREQMKMQTIEAQYSLDVVELFMEGKKTRSICDVGCGPGTLLVEAQKRGYDILGVEPNSKCHRLLKENNISFISEFFPLKQPMTQRFDAVFILNTLEHLPDPLSTLEEIKKILVPEGIIYISVPNIDALVNRIMHEKAGVFGGHSHLQFFNSKTLTKLLEKAGFDMLEYETIITEIGVIKNYLSYKDPYFGENAEALDFFTPELIYKHHLARNINMVGRLKD